MSQARVKSSVAAKTRSTDSAGSLAISATQSPIRIRPDSIALQLKRGARRDAPRRDTTMTQNSDSGDAAGDAGPTTDSDALWASKVKIGLTGSGEALGKNCLVTILAKP